MFSGPEIHDCMFAGLAGLAHANLNRKERKQVLNMEMLLVGLIKHPHNNIKVLARLPKSAP